MAELAWLSSPPTKVTVNGNLSSASSFTSSNENLFDLLQGRLGSGGFGAASDSTPFFRSSDQMSNVADTDSTTLLKAEDDSLQTAELAGMQSSLWVAADNSLGVGVAHGLFNSTTHHVIQQHPGHGIDSSQLSPYPKPHDPSPQLQALREFMAYGNNTMAHQQSHSENIAGPPMFLHLGEESTTPGSLLVGVPGHQRPQFVGDNSSSQSKPDILAYRALCQADHLLATERSPHRTQFQRENHILAERQRREEMNEKFSALRSMIPKATKKDKASIVGDTIAYVLELEKTLKHLQACKTSRQGYFRILKRKPSLAIVDDRDRPISCSPSAPSDYAAEVMKGPVCTRSEDSLQKRCKEREEAAISSSEEFSGDSSPQKPKGKEVPVIVSKSQVDVQHLGEQAVIKIVCARSPGLVLRVLQALEECKVEILQSNVTTVARNSVHFITVQISSGLSSSTEEMIQALHLASNPDQVAALI